MRLAPFLVIPLVLLAAPSAHAEVTAWVAASGGTTFLTTNESEVRVRGSMAFDGGIGSSPADDYIVGSFFRVAPIVAEGTDMMFFLRGATRGFQVGDFGLAVDLGGFVRVFDPALPGGGFIGEVVVGAPLGLQLALSGHAGTEKSYGGSAVLGLDFLRLTIYRQSLTEWWPNPLSPTDPTRRAPETASR